MLIFKSKEWKTLSKWGLKYIVNFNKDKEKLAFIVSLNFYYLANMYNETTISTQ